MNCPSCNKEATFSGLCRHIRYNHPDYDISTWREYKERYDITGSKICGTCKIEKSLSEFHKSSKRGFQSICKSCNRIYNAARSRTVKDKYNAQRKAHILECRRKVFEYLLEHPCVDCGDIDPIVMEFDHRDRSTKIAGVGALLAKAVRWERIEAEIAKCDVRCVKCHRRRTAKQLGFMSLTFERKGS